MKTFNPTAAYKPKAPFNSTDYKDELEKTLSSISDTGAFNQYLQQEMIKTRYNVSKNDGLTELLAEYNVYLSKNETGIIGKEQFENAEEVPEPDYNILDNSPIYPYEKNLNLTMEKKKEMMKKIVRYLRRHNIYVLFARTIADVTADDTKGEYIELNPDGTRDLPIGELMGNKIILNPWNVDFMSTFLTIGHLYGHMVQEMTLEEYKGIREFLSYPKPLNMELVQKHYFEKYGGRDYKKDFKVFEEEAFAYAKYTFDKAEIEWNKNLEHAMRTYIDTDFDELWEWSTQAPEKSAQQFMERYEQYYQDEARKNHPILSAKEVGIQVVASNHGAIKVVREGKL
jgi:hypothetical protein